jgi:hypothetical protein
VTRWGRPARTAQLREIDIAWPGDDAPKDLSTVWQFLRPAQRTPTMRALERGY